MIREVAHGRTAPYPPRVPPVPEAVPDAEERPRAGRLPVGGRPEPWRRSWRILGFALAFAAAVLASPSSAGAQESCDEEGADLPLSKVEFSGNKEYADTELQDQIVNEPSSLFRRIFRFFGAKRCLQPSELQGDIVRLMLYYRRHGFPQVKVDTQVTRRKDDARLTFRISEGPAAKTDSVLLIGQFDDSTRRKLRDLVLLQPSERLDQFDLDTSRIAVQAELQARGFLQARSTARTQLEPNLLSGYAAIETEVGPRVRLEHVHVTSRPRNRGRGLHVSTGQIEKLANLNEGAVLSGLDIADARNNLLDAGIFGAVDVGVDSIRRVSEAEALADVQVTVLETSRHEARLEGGYGTLDCGRIQADVSRLSSIRTAGRLEATLRFSKIGVGDPLDFAESMCSSYAREDIYGQKLNYYAGLTYSHPALGRRGISRSLTIYTERRSEYQAYLRTVHIGVVASGSRRLPRRWLLTSTYDFSYGKTEAEPSVQCWILGACLPEDRAALSDSRPLGVLSAAISRVRTDHPVDPTRGYTLRLEARSALQAFGSNQAEQFAGVLFDHARYHPLSDRLTLAGRARFGMVGTILQGTRIPQQERLFAGGASTVRGSRQNQAGPLVFVPDSFQIVTQGNEVLLWSSPDSVGDYREIPSGGNSMAVANMELRWRPPVLTDLLQFVVFVDGGASWNRDEELGGFELGLLRWTPGIGVRAQTPIGPLRLDVGYNNYALQAGPAFRDVPFVEGETERPLYCASPGNTLGITIDPAGGLPIQEAGICPSTFAPSKPSNFWRRLTLHFSIGQAF